MAIAQDQNFQEKPTDTEQRFEAFMQSELVPAAEALESQRLAQRSKLVKQAWGFGILVAASIPLSMQMQSYAWTIGLGIVSALVLGITYSRSAKLNRQFKTGIAPLLVSRVCGGDARYTPYEGIPSSDFELAGLWSRKPDRYKASDGISGKKGKNWYRFSEVVAEYEAETRVRHGNSYSMETERHAIFTGVLFQTDFKKAFTGRLIIKRQGHDENIDLPRVALDDETFAQRFEVYATDSALAQSILSQVFMGKLLQLDHKFRNNLEFSFINGTIYVAHSTPDDRLESSMWTSYLDQESVRSTMAYLEQWVSVVDLLDLNGL